MPDLLPAAPLLAGFVFASLVLTLTPGPAVLYIVTRSVVHGRRAGLASVAGIALGNLGNALAAALGLAALFAVSALAFSVVKFLGAAYLIWLGVQMWRAKEVSAVAGASPAEPLARLFRDGFVVALLNPKTTIFFAAFLPQFLSPSSDASPLLQTMALGVLFVLIAGITDALYALASGVLAPRLAGMGGRGIARRVGGGMYIGMGLIAALSGTRVNAR